MLKILIALMCLVLLGACSTMPSGPSVLALPGTGKNFDLFHNDDQLCRQFVHNQIGSAQDKPDSREEAQQNYDIGYIQCMYGKGHRVPVPEELIYSTQQDWYPPPPPNQPAPETRVPAKSKR